MILEELRKAGLPDELSWLPLIESGFKVRALSRARALGLWQFISSTGYRFGLKRDRWIDERMDPLKSTQAAIRYLTELHDFFGEWTTALASYNCGEIRVQNVIRTQHINYLDNFWDLFAQLPYETARFVPRLLAALLIINNPEQYGFSLPTPVPPLKYETVTISHPAKLSSLSTSLGLEASTLAFYNPELRYESTPDQEYILKVPVDCGEKALAAISSLPRWIPPEATYTWHYVRSGETLSIIAKRYRTSVSAITRLNGLRSTRLIWPGQRLKIPGGGGTPVSSYVPQTFKPGEKITYSVKSGDYLYLIAKNFNTTVERIKEDNGLKSNILFTGQTLAIQTGRPDGAVSYKVNEGDTLFSIAQKFGMELNELLLINNLGQDSKIRPGQEIWVNSKK
jgi:membrane-bound lytic murein transglycosylase D